MSRDTYSLRDAHTSTDGVADGSREELSTDIRSLMGLLAGYLLMALPQEKVPHVDRLLVGEVQCIVREVLVASGHDEASFELTNQLLQWARSKQW